jgi:hypothetical protein
MIARRCEQAADAFQRISLAIQQIPESHPALAVKLHQLQLLDWVIVV